MKRIVLSVGAFALLGAAVAGAAPPAPKAPPPGAASNAACKLVTKVEAEEILGQPLAELESGIGDSCHYRNESDKGFVLMTELRGDQDKSTFESQTKAVAKMTGGKLKPAPGYGEQAVWIGDKQLVVLLHGKGFSVTQPGAKIPPAKLDAFLRKALSRL